MCFLRSTSIILKWCKSKDTPAQISVVWKTNLGNPAFSLEVCVTFSFNQKNYQKLNASRFGRVGTILPPHHISPFSTWQVQTKKLNFAHSLKPCFSMAPQIPECPKFRDSETMFCDEFDSPKVCVGWPLPPLPPALRARGGHFFAHSQPSHHSVWCGGRSNDRGVLFRFSDTEAQFWRKYRSLVIFR